MKLSESVKQKIVDKLEQEDATHIAVFGSYARGDANESSDIDILVQFSERKSLIDTARIERELSDATGREIDIVTENSLSPHIADRIEDREVLLA